MIYVSIAAGLTANLLYMFGIARVGPTRAGLFIHLVPVYGSIISITFLGEELHWFHAIGMAAILVGLTCSQRTPAAAISCAKAYRRFKRRAPSALPPFPIGR